MARPTAYRPAYPVDSHGEGGGLGGGGLHIAHGRVPRGCREHVHGAGRPRGAEAPASSRGRGRGRTVPLGEAVHHCGRGRTGLG